MLRDITCPAHADHSAIECISRRIYTFSNSRRRIIGAILKEHLSMSRPYINCGAQNAIEARFCRSCGHSFEVDATSSAQPTAPLQPSPSARTDSAVVCAKCGKENRDGTKFCRGCGAALAESRPENAAQEPHALVRPSVVPTPQKAFERSLRPPNAESIAPSRTAPPSLLGRLDNQ